MSHPCLRCGACCAHYRVGLHWSEAEPSLGGQVPAALTEPFGPHCAVMRGTWAVAPRCVALEADIGRQAHCTIHPQRPQACREVAASWEDGTPSAQCDRARLAHGLPALTPLDWLAPAPPEVDASLHAPSPVDAVFPAASVGIAVPGQAGDVAASAMAVDAAAQALGDPSLGHASMAVVAPAFDEQPLR